MKNKEIITIPESQLFVTLERLQYEIDSHKDLLSWLFAQNVHNDLVDRYLDEYHKLFKEYQIAKQTFEKEFILKNVQYPKKTFNWQVQFTTHEVIIEYLND